MPIQVQGPDGAMIEFPDGTPQATMESALKAHYARGPRQVSVQELRDHAAQFQQDHPVTDDMSFGQNFAAGAGKFFTDTGLSLRQLKAMIQDQVSPQSGASRNDVIAQEVDRKQATDNALMDTGGGNLGFGSALIGSLFVPAGLAAKTAAAAPRAAAVVRAITLPKTILGNTAQGVALGALEPVGTDDSRLANATVGGVGGFGGAVVGRGIAATPRAGRNLLGFLSGKQHGGALDREVADTLRRESANANGLLTAAPSGVPGVRRTLSEETLDPGIARLERKIRGTTNEFDALDRSNNAARVRAIRSFAGDEASLQAAKDARKAATTSLKNEAIKITGVDTNRLLSQIKRLETANEGAPHIQNGLRQVRELLTRDIPDAERVKLAKEPLTAFLTKGRKSAADFETAKAALSAIRRGEVPTGKFESETGQAALAEAKKRLARTTVGQDKGQVLLNVRETIGKMLSGTFGGDNSSALKGARALMAVKTQLDRVLSDQAQPAKQFIETFAAASKPINRMQLGQELISQRSGSAILDPVTGEQILTPARFSSAARNLDQTAAAATGFRKAKAANILEPQDRQIIDSVQQDLERRNFAQTSGSGGNSHTDERSELGKRLIRGGIVRVIPLFNAAAEFLDKQGQARLHGRLAEVLANPEQARELLARLPAEESQALRDALTAAGGIGGQATVRTVKQQ